MHTAATKDNNRSLYVVPACIVVVNVANMVI